jgi:hypothetical protein
MVPFFHDQMKYAFREKKVKFVVCYNPKSRSYDVVSNSWKWENTFGPEKGWRDARMNELGKWIQGKCNCSRAEGEKRTVLKTHGQGQGWRQGEEF